MLGNVLVVAVINPPVLYVPPPGLGEFAAAAKGLLVVTFVCIVVLFLLAPGIGSCGDAVVRIVDAAAVVVPGVVLDIASVGAVTDGI